MTDTKWVKIILGDFSNDFQNYRVIKKRHPLLGRDDMVSWKDGHGIFKYNLFKYYLENFVVCNQFCEMHLILVVYFFTGIFEKHEAKMLIFKEFTAFWDQNKC